MLEPPTPAGEPFGAQEEENKVSADFESVCISLVERGWKIMPKKGTYPINKKGPRYVNLVDPRGNRKSVRVIDEALWGKLREAEARRTNRISGDKEESQPQVIAEESKAVSADQYEIQKVEESSVVSIQNSQPSLNPNQPEQEISNGSPSENLTNEEITAITEESIESKSEVVQEKTETVSSSQVEFATKAEIVENPPKEFQSFALSSPGLQKSIFDLGFETLLNALQNEALSPSEIVSKIQEWSAESKNLLEFVHKFQEKDQQASALPDSSEKDELITELQSTLKGTEDKLAETLKALREM